MRILVDNNLPVILVRALRTIMPGRSVTHVRDVGLSAASDADIKHRLGGESIAWITRDEDFWLDAPSGWAVVWISVHNPTLAFLRDAVAPALARTLPSLKPGARWLVTEETINAER